MGFSVDDINSRLKYKCFDIKYFDSVTSTNDVVRDAAKKGFPEGFTVIADSQLTGRGSKNRNFFSPCHTGLYMSVLLRPSIDVSGAGNITPQAAVATCRAIEKVFGKYSAIKWVNDLYLDGRKICGILTESAMNINSDGFSYIILGIGVNVYPPEHGFPSDISEKAGSVCDSSESADRRGILAAEILNEFAAIYFKKENAEDCFSAYKKRCFILGKRVEVVSGNDRYTACAVSLTDDYGLVVVKDNGDRIVLHSGEVSLFFNNEPTV